MQGIREANKTIYAIVSTTVKLLLFAPLIAAVMLVNYFSISSAQPTSVPLTQEELYDIAIAKALLAGKNLTGYDQLDERKIMSLFVEYLETPLNTVALGSSRVMQLNQSISGSASYFNCGMSGSDFYDILGTFYLFDRAGKLPENLIIALDPWLLNGNPDASTPRSDKELYNEFLTLKLGIDMGYEEPQPEEAEPVEVTPTDLLDIDAFRRNLFAGSPAAEEETPAEVQVPVVEGDVYEQSTNIKLGDGSVMYVPAFRNADPETVEAVARVDAGNFLWMEGYTQPDSDRCAIFERFVQYATGQGVNVVLLMIPYHPTVYSFATENVDRWPGFFETEPWFVDFALQNDIPIYGTYNPFVANCWQEDFYDGLHIKGEALGRIFPGIQEVEAEQALGQAGSPYHFAPPRITPEAALQIAQYCSPIAEPHVYILNGTTIVNSQDCYVIDRYSNGPGSTKVASYAVSMDEGVFFRYNTNNASWVVDKRF